MAILAVLAMWQALLVVAMEVSLLILQRELFKILTECLHLCPHLLEWVQLKDVAGENCHPLRDPDPRPFITWVSRVQGAPTPPILIWIQPATEQVCKRKSLKACLCMIIISFILKTIFVKTWIYTRSLARAFC